MCERRDTMRNKPISKEFHYKIALETYRLDYLANHDYSNFNDNTVDFISHIDEKLKDNSINQTKLKKFLDDLDEKIVIALCQQKGYSEKDSIRIAQQIIKMNANDYVTRSLSLDDYEIDEKLNVSVKTPFTSYKACSYYFVDRLKQLINTLDNPFELNKYPFYYKSFYNTVKCMNEDDWDKFEEHLQNYLKADVRKNNHLLMSTTASSLQYLDENDFHIPKYHDGFDTVLHALSSFLKKNINYRISIDTPNIENTSYQHIKIFLNQDVCLAFDTKGKVKNLLEYYSNIKKEKRVKLNNITKKV